MEATDVQPDLYIENGENLYLVDCVYKGVFTAEDCKTGETVCFSFSPDELAKLKLARGTLRASR